MELYDQFLRNMPIWLVFMFTVVVVLGSLCIGYRIGGYARRGSKDTSRMPSGSVVVGSLFILVFMLGFIFHSAANRFDTRKQIFLDEVNTIHTTYLRTGFLPEPQRDEIRKVLRDYVDLRAGLAGKDYWNKPDKIRQAIQEGEAMHDQIWSYAVEVGREYPDSEVVGLFISSLNHMIDLHNQRLVVALEYQIPGAIWGGLFLLSILTFGLVGFEMGASGGGSVLVGIVMTIVFSIVIMLITDLDRPMQGLIEVSQKPMIELQQKMRAESP